MPRTLLARLVLVIALVSIAFQIFAIAVVTVFALLPLGRQATDDFAALMIDAASSWRAAEVDRRPGLQQTLLQTHRLMVKDTGDDMAEFVRVLPYWYFLELSLSARTGQAVALRQTRTDGGQAWYWADIPSAAGAGSAVRVGFSADRVAVQPSLALLLLLGVGTLVTLITAAAMARWLIDPLARLASAMELIGQGHRPAPLPESGPDELAVVAREFNRMGAQVEELLANRTTLLAGMSHDLRSPLARIRLALGMLSEKPDPDLLLRVVRDVDAMNELIARCLDVSRDFSERESTLVDLCDLLNEVASEHRHTGVEIRGHRGPQCRLRVRQLALKRILSNLVENATRYGAGLPVDIEYAVTDRRVEIRVLDRGAGIPESEREAVFLPFHRLEASRSSAPAGSGLGLAIARQIARSNGWIVELQPRPGGGTAAIVRAPLESGSISARGD